MPSTAIAPAAMQRTAANPLTPGVYRVDLKCEDAHHFGRWRRAQKGKVHLLELENGPNGTARVNFVVFDKPGAFPFGKLGKPVPGVVGALPDWADVVSFVFPPLTSVQTSLGAQMGEYLAQHAVAELAGLRDAVTIARANMDVIEAQLKTVREGKAMNPAAILHNAATMTANTLELLTTRAAAIPANLPRHVVDNAILKLRDLGDAIKAAPGKALHALTQFPGQVLDNWLKPFVLPYEIGMLGLGLVVLGGFMAYEQKRTTPTTTNLMLAGGALAILGGGTLASNVSDLLPRDAKK